MYNTLDISKNNVLSLFDSNIKLTSCHGEHVSKQVKQPLGCYHSFAVLHWHNFVLYTALELCMSAFHLMFPYCVARLLVAILKPSIGDQETLMKQNTARRGNQYTVLCPQITKYGLWFKAILPQLSLFMTYNLYTGNNNHRQSTTIEWLLFTYKRVT